MLLKLLKKRGIKVYKCDSLPYSYKSNELCEINTAGASRQG